MILHWNKRLANTDNKSYCFLFINLKECDDFLYCLFENSGEFPSRIVCGKIAREKRIKLLVFIALICSIYFFTNFVIILILTSFLFCFYFKHMNSLDNCRNKIRKNIYMCMRVAIFTRVISQTGMGLRNEPSSFTEAMKNSDSTDIQTPSIPYMDVYVVSLCPLFFKL